MSFSVGFKPPMFPRKLHVLEIVTTDDLVHFIQNDKTPENRRMLEYLLRMFNEKYGIYHLADDYTNALMASYVEWGWFLKDLEGEKQK